MNERAERELIIYLTNRLRNIRAFLTVRIFFAHIIMHDPFGKSNIVGNPSRFFSFVPLIKQAGKISSQKVHV